MFFVKRELIKVYEMLYPHIRHIKFKSKYRFPILNPQKTVQYIKKKNCSIARFGDGEFGIILGTNEPAFQNIDDDLKARLIQVLLSSEEKCLICLPNSFITTKTPSDDISSNGVSLLQY